MFRYEIRLWSCGRIPDVAGVVDSPPRLTDDEDDAGNPILRQER
jgi:hypothetical protein